MGQLQGPVLPHVRHKFITGTVPWQVEKCSSNLPTTPMTFPHSSQHRSIIGMTNLYGVAGAPHSGVGTDVEGCTTTGAWDPASGIAAPSLSQPVAPCTVLGTLCFLVMLEVDPSTTPSLPPSGAGLFFSPTYAHLLGGPGLSLAPEACSLVLVIDSVRQLPPPRAAGTVPKGSSWPRFPIALSACNWCQRGLSLSPLCPRNSHQLLHNTGSEPHHLAIVLWDALGHIGRPCLFSGPLLLEAKHTVRGPR